MQIQSFNSCLLAQSIHAEPGIHLMSLSYLPVDPLTWFLGSLDIWAIKCCFHSNTKPKVYEMPQIIIRFFASPTQPSRFAGVPRLTSTLSARGLTFVQVWPRFSLTDSAQCYQLSCSSTYAIIALAGWWVRLDRDFIALGSLLGSFKLSDQGTLRRLKPGASVVVSTQCGCRVWVINTARTMGMKLSIAPLDGLNHLPGLVMETIL